MIMNKNKYDKFLKNKNLMDTPSGFECIDDLHPALFSFQQDIIRWALRRGRAALFEDCGLGKTIQQLEWARHVVKQTKKSVIIFAPLAVSHQTVQEGKKFNIKVHHCKDQKDIKFGINITNYERLNKFKPDLFSGIVLDESSIIKNMNGVIRNELILRFGKIPYRLACTATPSPNDYMELGNHSEFLGVMSHQEMLGTFFINDSNNTGKWRLKGHVQKKKFWEWLCSWAIMISNPADLGYDNTGFILPALNYHEHILPYTGKNKKGFFNHQIGGLVDRKRIRKETIEIRCKYAADLINNLNDSCVVWCGLNNESKMLTDLIAGAIEIRGSHSNEYKSKCMLDFANGKIKRIVTKPKIAGFGMNWQICNKAFFVGLNDSWESLYQATRRIWRFGQARPVDIHIIIEEREKNILENIKRKDAQANKMAKTMSSYTDTIVKNILKGVKDKHDIYLPQEEMQCPNWWL